MEVAEAGGDAEVRGLDRAAELAAGVRHFSKSVDRQQTAIADALVSCLAVHGLAKTTVDDIARAAGCSRATVYRVFPGGKDEMLSVAVELEASRLLEGVAARMDEKQGLEEALAAGVLEAAARLRRHPALEFMLLHEPGPILTLLAFGEMDVLLESVKVQLSPVLGRWLRMEGAERISELATRMVLSYMACPASDMELSDPGKVQEMVQLFLLPAARQFARESREPRGAEHARHEEGTG